MREINSVVLTMLISLASVWIFASADFALNITACWIFFILLELYNKKKSGKTISQKFWRWMAEAPKWKAIIACLGIAYVGIYFALHLFFKV